MIVAVCTDLFFAVKIEDAARRVGRAVKFVKTLETMREAALGGASLILLDLNCREADPLGLIGAMKSDPATAAIPQVAFVSHVQADTIRAAREAGCDRVMARSAFVKDLADLLKP